MELLVPTTCQTVNLNTNGAVRRGQGSVADTILHFQFDVDAIFGFIVVDYDLIRFEQKNKFFKKITYIKKNISLVFIKSCKFGMKKKKSYDPNCSLTSRSSIADH